MGRPHLVRSRKKMKLLDQVFVEPTILLKGDETIIMGISTMVNFEINDLVEGNTTYVGWEGRPRGRNMKEKCPWRNTW